MSKLNNDPMKSIGYMFGTELWPNNNQIAKQINGKYFTSGKKYEEQLDEMEKVFISLSQDPNNLKLSVCTIFITLRCYLMVYFLKTFNIMLTCIVNTATSLLITMNFRI
jgi:hypothetical protein